jgi:hypothetical protein
MRNKTVIKKYNKQLQIFWMFLAYVNWKHHLLENSFFLNKKETRKKNVQITKVNLKYF